MTKPKPQERIVAGVVWYPPGPLKGATKFRFSGPKTESQFHESVGGILIELGYKDGRPVEKANVDIWDTHGPPLVDWKPLQKSRKKP